MASRVVEQTTNTWNTRTQVGSMRVIGCQERRGGASSLTRSLSRWEGGRMSHIEGRLVQGGGGGGGLGSLRRREGRKEGGKAESERASEEARDRPIDQMLTLASRPNDAWTEGDRWK